MKCLRKKIWIRKVEGLWGYVHEVFGKQKVADIAYGTDAGRVYQICELIALGIRDEELKRRN